MDKSRTVVLLIAFLFALFLSFCDNNSGPKNEITELMIIPVCGKVGDKVKLYRNPLEDFQNSYSILFTNASDWTFSDSVSPDTIYAHVPFTATSGPITVWGLTEMVVKSFSIDDYPTNEITICWSDLNYQITKMMAQTAWTTDKIWTAEKSADTISMYGYHSTWDYSTLHILRLLDKGKNILPELVSAETLMLTDYQDTIFFPINIGMIKIQDWDTDRIIGGRVLADPYTSYFNDYIFWYDFSETSK